MYLSTDFLRISPLFAAAWLTPKSLRFGFSSPQLIMGNMTTAIESVISLLLQGASLATIERHAARQGVGREELTELLQLLSPVLDRLPDLPDTNLEELLPHGCRVSIAAAPLSHADGAQTVKLLQSALEGLGLRVVNEDPQVCIKLSRYLLTKTNADAKEQLARPVLPVIFADCDIRIGPTINKLGFPCVSCLEHSRVAADPEKPLLAAQLMSRKPLTESPLSIALIAPTVAQLCQAALGGAASTVGSKQYVFDFTSPPPLFAEAQEITANPDCLCSDSPLEVRDGNLCLTQKT
ncbi:hypothetical protein [Canibacter zhoujuaniae]|uniref:hypothetical protein n=1 Tax=Canibacter zhoujuaniae TaxID=2708343 RepID=UPI00141DDF04|nr:hypothetical protein [Canibacter zhoujuaniae]